MIDSIIALAESFSCAESYEEMPWPIWENWDSMRRELEGFGVENISKTGYEKFEYSGFTTHVVE